MGGTLTPRRTRQYRGLPWARSGQYGLRGYHRSEHRIARALQTGEAHEARIHLPTPSQLRKLLRHRLIRMCGKKSPHRVIISRLMLTSKPASWVSAVPVNKGITSKVLTANAGCSAVRKPTELLSSEVFIDVTQYAKKDSRQPATRVLRGRMRDAWSNGTRG